MAKLNKKGMLFSLALTFLVLTLFALSILNYKASIMSTKATSQIMLYDKVKDMVSSIEASTRKMFHTHSNMEINLTIANKSHPEALISFSPMVNTSWTNLNSNMTLLEDFVDANVSFVNITSNFNINEVNFSLRFHNQSKIVSFDKSTDTRIVIQDSPLIQRYDITILDVANGTPSWSSQNSGSANDILINLTVFGAASWRQTLLGFADPTQISKIVTTFAGSSATFNISIDSNQVRIDHSNTNITSSLLVLNMTTTDVQIQLPTIIRADISSENLILANKTKLM